MKDTLESMKKSMALELNKIQHQMMKSSSISKVDPIVGGASSQIEYSHSMDKKVVYNLNLIMY